MGKGMHGKWDVALEVENSCQGVKAHYTIHKMLSQVIFARFEICN